MRCREAKRRLTSAVAAGADGDLPRAVADHLAVCPGCRRRAELYARIRDDVREMEPFEAPEELDELVEAGIEEALAEGQALRKPPAVASPERSGAQKAAIFMAGLVGLLALTFGLLIAAGGEEGPRSSIARAVQVGGKVEYRTPGSSRWQEYRRGSFLPAHSQLRTGQEGRLRIQGTGVTWALPAMSAIQLEKPTAAKLVAGRLHARCSKGPGDPPVELTSENGSVTCRQGAFTAELLQKQLFVAVVAGSASVGKEKAREVRAPRAVLLVEGKPAGPVRKTRASDFTYWLKDFLVSNGGRLSGRDMASVPIGRGPLLPEQIKVHRLRLYVDIRGALAAVRTRAELLNEGERPWEGSLKASDLVLPPPLRSAGSDRRRIGPGERAELTSRAVSLMWSRAGAYSVGLSLRAWTARPIGKLQVSVTAEAAGGVESLRCATLGYSGGNAGVLEWSGRREQFEPGLPLVFEAVFSRPIGTAGYSWGQDGGGEVLLACRPGVATDPWLKEERNVLIAFDATADFGPGGRVAGHRATAGLLKLIPPGAQTGLIAYDGRLKLDRDRLMRHSRPRVEAMLENLWRLESTGQGRPQAFLKSVMAIAQASQKGALVFFITGRNAPPRGTDWGMERGPRGVRLAVLQVGAERPAAPYRELCALTGGVTVAIPGAVAAELGALDLVANLQWAGTRHASVQLQGRRARGLPRMKGRFANQPILAVVPEVGNAGLSGVFRVAAGGKVTERQFAVETP